MLRRRGATRKQELCSDVTVQPAERSASPALLAARVAGWAGRRPINEEF